MKSHLRGVSLLIQMPLGALWKECFALLDGAIQSHFAEIERRTEVDGAIPLLFCTRCSFFVIDLIGTLL